MSRYHSARVYALLLPLATALLACNNSSTSTPPPTDTTAPTVSSTSPVDGATDLATSSAVTATFDEDIFAATVDGTSFTLFGNGNVSGTVSFDGATNTATFTPDTTLGLFSPYTATLTTGVTDLSGNGLASNYSWSFTTGDGVWGTAGLLEEDDTGQALGPRIVTNANGFAVAAWVQSDGTNYLMTVNRYVPGEGWQGAELAQTDATKNSDRPRVAIDSDGNITVVWVQENGGRYSLWSRHYLVATGWGAAQLIETDDTGDADYPELGVDGNGNVIAVWHQYDGARHNILTNRYEAGAWGVATLLESDNNSAAYPRIAMTDGGDAMAVWVQSDGVRANTMAARFIDGSGWTAPEEIDAGNDDVQSSPRVAIDASGSAIAVWYQLDGGTYGIFANRFVPGGGWGVATAIDSINQNAYYPEVAMTPDGNALVVWSQSDGTRYNIWSQRYENGSGWVGAELVETDDTGATGNANVAIDVNGNGMAVWVQDDGTGTFNMMAGRYLDGTGWGTPALIETNDQALSNEAELTVDADGRVTAIWAQSNGTEDSIYANRFE